MSITDALEAIREENKAARPVSWKSKGRAVIFIELTQQFELFGDTNFSASEWDFLAPWEVIELDEVFA